MNPFSRADIFINRNGFENWRCHNIYVKIHASHVAFTFNMQHTNLHRSFTCCGLFVSLIFYIFFFRIHLYSDIFERMTKCMEFYILCESVANEKSFFGNFQHLSHARKNFISNLIKEEFFFPFVYLPYSLAYPYPQSVDRTFLAIHRVLVRFWCKLLDPYVQFPLVYDCIRSM